MKFVWLLEQSRDGRQVYLCGPRTITTDPQQACWFASRKDAAESVGSAENPPSESGWNLRRVNLDHAGRIATIYGAPMGWSGDDDR